MKMTKLVMSAILGLSMTTAAFAASPSAFVQEDETYSDVAQMDARITRSINTFEIELAEPIDAVDVSLWYMPSRSCGSFQIHSLKFVGADDQWVNVTSTPYLGVHHFRIGQQTNKIAVELSTDRLFGMSCKLVLKKADFIVPQMMEILGKYTSVCTNDVCLHTLTRIDSDLNEVLTITEETALQYKLEEGVIYKAKGFLDPNSTENNFVILSAQRIL